MENLRNTAYKALRKSEGFFKTDMVYLAKGGFWLSGGQVAVTIIGFLLSLAFANLLLPEIYGIYKYIVSLAAILSALSLSGLSTALVRATAKGFDGSFMKAFWLNTRWGLIITFAAGLGSLYYYLNGNNLLATGLLIVGFLSPLIDGAELYDSFLIGKKNFRLIAILKLWRALATSLVMFIAILLSKDPLILVFTYFSIHTLTTLSLFFYVRTKSKLVNTGVDPEMAHLAKHTSVMNSLAIFSDSIDNILIFHYFGPIQLAIYNFALAIPNQLGGFLKSINTLAAPKFANQEKKIFQESMMEKSMRVFLVGAFVTIVYIFSAPFIFKLFFPQYLISIPYSQVYSVILLFSAALPVAFLDAQMAIKEKYSATILSNAFKVGAIFFGLYYFGLWGLVVGRVISKMFSVFMAFFFARRV
jgi:O-antigen/teichoic acid export membrane protein